MSSGVLDETALRLIGNVDGGAVEVLTSAPKPVSMVIGPDGTPTGEPLVGREGIVYAEVDLSRAIREKQFHDIVGSYQRFDLLRLSVDTRRRDPVEVHGAGRLADVPAPGEPSRGSVPSPPLPPPPEGSVSPGPEA